jgi:hypothetical protein
MSADTRPEVERRYATLLMAKSPQERVAMCLEMSSAARTIVRRSLEQSGLAGDALADAFVARIYGGELSPAVLAACQARIRRSRAAR